MQATERHVLPIAALRLNGGTQPRALVDHHTALEYADALSNGAEFPPVTVFYDGAEYWLADGFHRVEAHKQMGRDEVMADVRQGTRRDAVLFSVGANAQHGLRRTNADKRRAVETLLRDSEWAKWSNVEVGRKTGTSDEFVRKLRAEISPPTVGGERTYTTKHGTQATMQVSNMGKRPAPAPAPAPLTVDAAPLLPPVEDDMPFVDMETGEILPAPEHDYDSPAALNISRPDEQHVIRPVSDYEFTRAQSGWDEVKRLDAALAALTDAVKAVTNTYTREELARLGDTRAAGELLLAARLIRAQQVCAEFLELTDAQERTVNA